ncbi:serine hydrolase domain-containing protein [Actinokineospora spheciospongiae]|uniref:serine hydrolase domain-containing protein n=1 Tax=Actinokineospora spheciospongiae TaxID=909613 RepID=UPI000D9CC79F|nr:serine hydrolase domain-containing protein [Actinokineospora spheciospongiae]PWW66585.1 D-alanyl-D-alanine carboxypeptidase [Actinokineospora spheciospongiae]
MRCLLVTTAICALIGASTTPARAQAAEQEQDRLNAYRVATGSVGAAVTTRDGDAVAGWGSGRTAVLTGVAPDEHTRFRVGSQTKMFVATVLLQLVDEGRLDLEAPIEQVLPGVVHGPGIDPNAITVRHLLEHRSGIPDYLGFVGGDYLQTAVLLLNPTWQITPPTPQRLVDEGTGKGAQFAPGQGGAYSNTGYTVLGMLVEKLTGQDLRTAIKEQVLDRVGMPSTFLPAPGQKALPAPASHGYLSVGGMAFADVTGYEPAVWGAAGGLVSTGEDLTAFLNALFSGELVSPTLLTQMRDVAPGPGLPNYGLGLQRYSTDCGQVWGHSGQIAGYTTLTVGDGERAVSIAINNTPVVADSAAASQAQRDLVNHALCG